MFDDDRGHRLAHDLELLGTKLRRRPLLQLIGSAGLLPLIGCEGDDDGGGDASDDSDPCSAIPAETAGPYPGDGSNGPNALALAGIVRSDIRSSVGDAAGTAEGVPLTLRLTLVSRADGCVPLAARAVYVWHCDRDGFYSLYTLPEQNYLRGVQETEDDGTATFLTIFPACYPGRWPHFHFEVYPSLAAATQASTAVATSQLALPAQVCDEVFATEGYEASVTTFAQISLGTDGVFRDGASLQMASMTGSLEAGYVASWTIVVDD